MENAFVTGSRVYGTPRPDSDIDLCVTGISELDYHLLRENADDHKGSGDGSLVFGRLNLILLDAAEFEVWREATNELAARKPVTREEAVREFKDRVLALRKR